MSRTLVFLESNGQYALVKTSFGKATALNWIDSNQAQQVIRNVKNGNDCDIDDHTLEVPLDLEEILGPNCWSKLVACEQDNPYEHADMARGDSERFDLEIGDE